MTYFMGVYTDYLGESTLTISDGLDGLNCETLANPGVFMFDCDNIGKAINKVRPIAKEHNVKYLEINTSNSYDLIKVS